MGARNDALSIRIDLAGGGRVGPGKIAVLEEIERTGSISAAGRSLGMSYRRTWTLVEDLNALLGEPVVATAAGGAGGGGAVLTEIGRNVALGVRGAAKVSMEDVLNWDPQVIFVQDLYAPVAAEIRNGAAWQPITAVRDNRIYITPEYVKPWGYPLPEALALGELWMAKKLYPDRFADIDMQSAADKFYRTFYGVPYAGPN